jgi:hypothetical protein
VFFVSYCVPPCCMLHTTLCPWGGVCCLGRLVTKNRTWRWHTCAETCHHRQQTAPPP